MLAPIDVNHIHIETPRLLLDPLCEGYLEDMHQILSDPAVSDLAGFPLCRTLEDSRVRMERCLQKKDTLAVLRKDTGKLVGILTLQGRSLEEYPIPSAYAGREMGFFLARSCWGQGLMPEAVRAVCQYCYETLGFDYITCGHFPRNGQSARVIEKCGFSHLFDTIAKYSDGRQEPLHCYIRYNPNIQEENHV